MTKSKTYSEKLRDPRWQKKRLEVLENAKFECSECGTTEKELHVHHRFYEKGKDPWDYHHINLQCLCVECHKTRTELLEQFYQEIGYWDNVQLTTFLSNVMPILQVGPWSVERFCFFFQSLNEDLKVIHSKEEDEVGK